MLPYYLLLIAVFLFTLVDFAESKEARLIVYGFLCALLVAFAGLRGVGVDNDGIAYEDALNLASNLSWGQLFSGNFDFTMERGYMLLNKTVSTLGGDVHVVFVIMALATGLVNYTLIYRRSPYPFCSLLVYVCFFYFYRDFTQIRYALSAGIGMWAVFMFVDRKYIHAALLIFFAAFFHSSVLIIPLLFLAYALLRNYWVYFFLPILGAVGAFFDPVMYLFQLGGLPPTLAIYVEQNELGSGGYMVSVVAQVFMLAVLIYKRELVMLYTKRKVDILYIALSVGSFVNLLFISFAIMQRLSSMLFMAIVFLLPYLFSIIESKQKEEYTGLFIRFLFMVFVLYYGLNMIDTGLLRSYRIL